MTSTDSIGYVLLTVLVLFAAVVAMGAALLLQRRGLIRENPFRYLPHFVLLLTIALTPMTAHGSPTLPRAARVLGVILVIWLIGVSLSSQMQKRFSRKSPNTR
jgi:hypothetical protein